MRGVLSTCLGAAVLVRFYLGDLIDPSGMGFLNNASLIAVFLSTMLLTAGLLVIDARPNCLLNWSLIAASFLVLSSSAGIAAKSIGLEISALRPPVVHPTWVPFTVRSDYEITLDVVWQKSADQDFFHTLNAVAEGYGGAHLETSIIPYEMRSPGEISVSVGDQHVHREFNGTPGVAQILSLDLPPSFVGALVESRSLRMVIRNVSHVRLHARDLGRVPVGRHDRLEVDGQEYSMAADEIFLLRFRIVDPEGVPVMGAY